MKIEDIKNKQIEELKSICQSNDVDFNTMNKLLQSERVKKLRKRNHYIQQTIDSEIEKIITNEDK
ncbi:DNA modification system-associated small protein [Maribellus maritimus]|uniref:DNA modification system-associated small protein n=1 Tax=Maribellus maritimus TaxID=2870838 RepID=UPI00374D58A8